MPIALEDRSVFDDETQAPGVTSTSGPVSAPAAVGTSNRLRGDVDPELVRKHSDEIVRVLTEETAKALRESAVVSNAAVAAAHASAAPTPEHIVDTRALINGVQEKLPEDIFKKVKEAVDGLSERVQKFLRLQAKLDRCEKNIGAMQEGRWPPFLKPHETKVEVAELDEQVPQELTEWSFSLDLGASYRDLFKKFHEESTLYMKKVNKALYTAQLDNMRPRIVEDNFVQECCASGLKKQTVVSSFGSKLGINLDHLAKPQNDLTIAKAKLLYEKLMVSLAEQHEKETTKKEEEKKQIDARIQKLGEASPHKLLESAILQVMEKVLGKSALKNADWPHKDKRVDYAKAYDASGGVETFEDCFVDAASPTHFSGYARRGRGRMKGRGRGRGSSGRGSKGRGARTGSNKGAGRGKNSYLTAQDGDQARLQKGSGKTSKSSGKGKSKDQATKGKGKAQSWKGKGKGHDGKGGKKGKSPGPKSNASSTSRHQSGWQESS